MTRAELVSWFQEHREQNSRQLSVHVSNVSLFLFGFFFFFYFNAHVWIPPCPLKVVGFGVEENDEEAGGGKQGGDEDKEEDLSGSAYGEVSKLTFLPASSKIAGAIPIMDIPTFTEGLPLFPYHKILE